MAKRGRENAYEQIIKPNLNKIKIMVENGALDKDIYSALKIGKSTWFKYKAEHKEFMDFIKLGRLPLVADVENAMFKSALGGTEVIKKGMKVKHIDYKEGKKVHEYETVELYEETVYTPPNPTSGKFLLMNWDKEHYTNDPQAIDLKRKEFEHRKRIDEANNMLD